MSGSCCSYFSHLHFKKMRINNANKVSYNILIKVSWLTLSLASASTSGTTGSHLSRCKGISLINQQCSKWKARVQKKVLSRPSLFFFEKLYLVNNCIGVASAWSSSSNHYAINKVKRAQCVIFMTFVLFYVFHDPTSW